MIENISFGETKLEPGLFKQRSDVNLNYLMELKNMALLQNFYLEAGVIMPGVQSVPDPSKLDLHWGWEAPMCQLRGHFLGHWLSAASMIYATYGGRELKAKLDTIIEELGKCQKLNGGEWIGSIPQKYFEIMETDRYIWSPQYTMQKTVMGLLHAKLYAGSDEALDIVSKLADWYVKWVKMLDDKGSLAENKGESGGMLEVWAWLYELTKDEKYMFLAEHYTHHELYDDLLNGKDPLTNNHTNASIPMAHGAAKMYEVTGDKKWLDIVEKFWECAVTNRGSFCTTGNNAGEFWIPPHSFGRYLGDRSQEFCTVYNMVRLADYLFKFTGKKEYADYIEKCLYNGFLAQQNRFTGMPTYFLPTSAGGKKVWGSKRNDFWCCHGTMVQAQAIYPLLCYYKEKESDKLIVNQFIPSKTITSFAGKEVVVTMNNDMKFYVDQSLFDEAGECQTSRWHIILNVQADNAEGTIAIRLPEWSKSKVEIMVSGNKITPEIQDGYIVIAKVWNNDEIDVLFNASLQLSELEDVKDMVAVMEGPIVLAGICDSDKGLFMSDDIEKVLVPFKEHTYDTFPWQQSTYMTTSQPENFRFQPLYDVLDEKYTLYFTKKHLD
ncbi:MAG: glycoside hydrolase family 127 protein [Lachnospiraceae bacterium]|nr:glycoside hydrolase family 127 protein [Lachnospiraceae bacterium]